MIITPSNALSPRLSKQIIDNQIFFKRYIQIFLIINKNNTEDKYNLTQRYLIKIKINPSHKQQNKKKDSLINNKKDNICNEIIMIIITMFLLFTLHIFNQLFDSIHTVYINYITQSIITTLNIVIIIYINQVIQFRREGQLYCF